MPYTKFVLYALVNVLLRKLAILSGFDGGWFEVVGVVGGDVNDLNS